MLWKKIKQFRKTGLKENLKYTRMPLGRKGEKDRAYPLFAAIGMIMLILTGCSDETQEISDIGITQADNEEYSSDENDSADAQRI